MATTHGSYQAQNKAGTITITVLAVIFLALRFLARWVNNRCYGVDDILLCFAMVTEFALLGLNLSAVRLGMGLHIEDFPLENLVIVLKLSFAFEYIYSFTMSAVKLSVLVMYYRIFIDRPTRIGIYIVGTFVTSWLLASIVANIFQCVPVAKYWNTTLPGHCMNRTVYFVMGSAPHILSDIAMLCLPVRCVWKLHTSVTHRIAIIGIFLLGSFVTFTTCYRMVPLLTYDQIDTTYSGSVSITWTIIEVSSGIISACLPTLRPVLKLASRRFDSTKAGATKNSYQSLNRVPENNAATQNRRIITAKPSQEEDSLRHQPSDEYLLDRWNSTSIYPKMPERTHLST
ncbi:hypothetical protein BGW36DRAFT_369246 [Talaromyces proteolyticus]|uniref:Rhodopsin domain-containing protein n=1 Tax=Talaromyces proteolyticus TaxID=1131652 RepID=A0AAD4Q4U4_9EURO|nr:uncharacterized protein BGW36DRAFT_369246 [Talaromyces proteolyticus]KAH8703370.1 hypothetical protein BGW36DRAFT_369246 [Talaromyces proteolyticus]